MSLRLDISRALRRFRREEDGANLVEFSLVVLLFLFLLFAIIDFGRIANAWVGANKATQIGARIAAVRPPACPLPAGVTPELLVNGRGTGAGTINFGSLCRAGTNVCAPPIDPNLTCLGATTNATANEIFTAVRPLLPPGTQINNLRFRYTYDENLGFLGGPYVPMVTVELEGVNFTYVSQLGVFIQALTGNASNLGDDLVVPRMSVSLPAEDLNSGTKG
jgi:Flp pilus assembly pilin Flp